MTLPGIAVSSVPQGLSSGVTQHFNAGHWLMLVTKPHDRLEEIVDAAVAGGVNIVQLRDKSASTGELLKTARRLRDITTGRALLVVNGSAEVAFEVGADGVHLPEQGQSVSSARETLRDDALIGRSVHSLNSALRAEQEGADYLIAGAIFKTASHPGSPTAGIGFLRGVCESVSIPVIAIGGVNPENAGDCIAAGAAGVAVLSQIMQANDPQVVAKYYRVALLPSPAAAGEGTGVGA